MDKKIIAEELRRIARELVAGENNIRRWYKKEYPSDELWEEIKANATFDKAYKVLKDGKSFYRFVGNGIDTVVRERIFKELAKRYANGKYKVIYELWLDSEEG